MEGRLAVFQFLHAADIHLDSPLKGLECYEGAPVDELRRATREAFQNLVQLAVDREVAFVVISGDLYDGNWKDYNTGLYFVAQMARLREAKIPVILIAGNHDAANKMTRSLRLPDNVRLLGSRQPETVRIDQYGVAIHGQSFAKAAVMDDLSAAYPPADRGSYNIGVLHTSATGREGHERYAPCTLDGLRAKQYDYWALGHVHQREVLHEDPAIVFAGNIQGRHIRETGSKGCTLVTVDDAGCTSLEKIDLDVLRWEVCSVDASDAETGDEVLVRVRERLQIVAQTADGRPLAVRVRISGFCPAHTVIASRMEQWTNEVRAAAIDVGAGRIWIEKVKLQTALPRNIDQAEWAEGPLGELIRYIEELEADDAALTELSGELSELRKKLPNELREGSTPLDLESAVAMREQLGPVRQLLVSRLHAAGEAR
jgi:DNA repair exonuclease SbcCD nuclease subunit